MRTPMSFFDMTPTGRIINRFSKGKNKSVVLPPWSCSLSLSLQGASVLLLGEVSCLDTVLILNRLFVLSGSDMYTIDEQLVVTLREYFDCLFVILSTVIVVSVVTPTFIICLIPIAFYYVTQQQFFVTSYRELKRLDSVGRSPIYALFAETLEGVSTIRAYNAQESFEGRLRAVLDRQQHAFFLTSAAKCWLAVRLELIGTAIIGFACLCAVLEHGRRGGNAAFAALAGLSISFALAVTQELAWSVRMASDLETFMVSVERIAQYCKIKSEAPRRKLMDRSLPTGWPGKGDIRFVGASLRYRPDLPVVLQGLNIHIPGGSKVGVVGRTGAGKSSIVVALMRIVELDAGRILIDGTDHKLVGLELLRSRIAVIPQDPMLFSGTIKTNLDPFDDHSEQALCDTLQRVGLFGDTSADGESTDGGVPGRIRSIYDAVDDRGRNFSVGERQLLVIARALLTGAKIVVMDEATAAVDVETDAMIQDVMKKEFVDATCITIAHRINTVMDSDFVLVMEDGKVAEFDSPETLLNDESTKFSGFVRAASQDRTDS